jgi:hypothetical protein
VSFAPVDMSGMLKGSLFGNTDDIFDAPVSLSVFASSNPQRAPLIMKKRLLLFKTVHIVPTTKTKSSSFQSEVINALNNVDNANANLLQDVIDAANEIADMGDTASVQIDDGNVTAYWPSGGLVLELSGDTLTIKKTGPTTQYVCLDCFPKIVAKVLHQVPRVKKVDTTGLRLYATPKTFGLKMRKKLCGY